MDGDGSTTDASQLGIAGEYMTGGHYVLQGQDGKWSVCTKVFSWIIQQRVMYLY